MSDLFSCAGKVAVVTGGGGVLGGAMASGLADAGAKVAVIGRRLEPLQSRVTEITSKGGDALAVSADVLQMKSLRAAKDRIIEEYERVDILINAAGGNMPGATIMPDQDFFDLSIDDFRKVSSLNLDGSVLPSMVFGKEMTERGGCIINISSMTAQLPFTRVVGYSSAKASIDNFTKWLATEMAIKYDGRVRVNAIAPGVFIGEQNRRLLLDENDNLTARGKTIIDRTPAKRFGEPEELISTLLYLCSDASSFVTGVIIPVDGGFSAFSGV